MLSFLFSFQMFGFGQLGNILKVTMFCRCVGSSFLYISHASYLCEWKVQKICCLLLQRNKWKFAYPKWWLCDCLPLTHFSIRTQILKTTKTPLFFYKKIEMNFTEKKSAKFLESKRAKVHVMIILSSSAQCARGFKALWNQMWLKWMWCQSFHQSFTRSSDCDQCDYKVSFKHALKLHTESKHLRINYSCNECDYKPTDKSSLKYNLASQHLGETQTILILKQPTKVH